MNGYYPIESQHYTDDDETLTKTRKAYLRHEKRLDTVCILIASSFGNVLNIICLRCPIKSLRQDKTAHLSTF